MRCIETEQAQLLVGGDFGLIVTWDVLKPGFFTTVTYIVSWLIVTWDVLKLIKGSLIIQVL